MTQPSLVARMLEALALDGHERVLEIGTGYGWQTVLLARLVADVVSVERPPERRGGGAQPQASRHPNAELVVGDGSAGMEVRAPFDAIVVSAVRQACQPRWRLSSSTEGDSCNQSAPGGRDDVVLFEHAGQSSCADGA